MNVGKRTVLAKSCKACNVFKQAVAFGLRRDGYRESNCTRCKNLSYRSRSIQLQQEARVLAHGHGSPWTGEDFRILEELEEAGHTAQTIAFTLGRTVYAVYTMQEKLRRNK